MFLNTGKTFLRGLAKDLGLWATKVTTSLGGIAISGSCSLIGMWADNGIHIQISQSCFGADHDVLYRTVQHSRDYTGGHNRWLTRRDLAHYYNWIRSKEHRQRREEQDREDFEVIRAAYQFRGYKKGARSIYMRLLHQEPPVRMNIKKIRRLMEKFGLICPVRRENPYRRMMRAMRTSHIAENLLNPTS